MAFDCVGLLQIVVHDDGPPDDATWAGYMEHTRQLFERAGRDHSRMMGLIISDRGVPNSFQRSEFMRFLDGSQLRSSLVSRSVLVRAVVRSVNLFNQAMRPFPPEQLAAALGHLKVPNTRHAEVRATLSRLQPRIPTARTLQELLSSNGAAVHAL